MVSSITHLGGDDNRLEDLELGTGEGVKQIVKVCFIVDNGWSDQST